jgi:truncated hemoglobin YjbI
MAGTGPAGAAPQGAYGRGLYRAIGGTPACRKLSEVFYARVARDPVLRPLFPGKTLTCAIEAFAAFLVQFLGGPSEDAQRRWWLSLRESHLRFRIGQHERDAWMSTMSKALDDVDIEAPVRTALRAFFARSSAHVVNAGPAPSAGLDGVEPPDGDFRQELAQRWDAQRALGEAVAAVRNADADRFIALAESSALRVCLEQNRAVLAALLAIMISGGDRALLDYARDRLRLDPALALERHYGRTLLHAASAAGDATTVELLLRLGSDRSVTDMGGHTALYHVGNGCQVPGGGDVVRLLVRAGANVDACGGVKHCTALHMAARRGNVEVAGALLDCGADIEARDSAGDTPLRRSVNCNKVAVAALLVSRGADVSSHGSKGLTPLSAARTSAMRNMLRSDGPG